MFLLVSGEAFRRISRAQEVDDGSKFLILIIHHGDYEQLHVRQVILQTGWFFTTFYL